MKTSYRIYNSVKPNHAVGECYKARGELKAGEFIDLHRDLNIHDPDNKYAWKEEVTATQAMLIAAKMIGGGLLFAISAWAFVSAVFILGGA